MGPNRYGEILTKQLKFSYIVPICGSDVNNHKSRGGVFSNYTCERSAKHRAKLISDHWDIHNKLRSVCWVGIIKCFNSQLLRLIKTQININAGWNKRATPKWVTKSCDNRYDKVCGWNSIKDVASCLVFNQFLGKSWPWPLTLTKGTVLCFFYPFLGKFDLDQRSRSLALGSLNAPYWVVP